LTNNPGSPTQTQTQNLGKINRKGKKIPITPKPGQANSISSHYKYIVHLYTSNEKSQN
jgi:hypothetical protein